jgi:hypothetical protein
LTATANQGYNFFYWIGEVSGTANPTTIVMNGNKTVGAYFQQGTLRESFHSVSNWTAKGAGAMTLDNVDYTQGSGSIKLTMPVRNGNIYITKVVNWDISLSQGDLRFWVFVSTTGTPRTIQIILSNDSNIKNYFQANIP